MAVLILIIVVVIFVIVCSAPNKKKDEPPQPDINSLLLTIKNRNSPYIIKNKLNTFIRDINSGTDITEDIANEVVRLATLQRNFVDTDGDYTKYSIECKHDNYISKELNKILECEDAKVIRKIKSSFVEGLTFVNIRKEFK